MDELEQCLAEAGFEVAVIYDGPPDGCPLCREARERQEAA
jgi:hypothetical protein